MSAAERGGHAPKTLQLESCTIDLGRRLVLRGPVETGLTQQEANLLDYLADRAGEVVRREQLLEEVWGYHPGVASRAVDSTVIRLRAKIERDPSEPRHLRSSYGHGYVLELLGAPPLGLAEPGLRTISAPGQTNLVRATDAAVGRAEEIAALVADLRAAPGLRTLVGPGGVGKTRVSREVGTRLIEALPGGVWFVALAEISDPAAMSAPIAEALGLNLARAPSAAEAETQLGHVLQARGPCLLLLDNLEQLGAGAASIVSGLLARAPEARVLATSRSPLGAPGERVIPLEPLPLADAVALFELRARKLRPGFRVTGANQSAVHALVERLDGLPLAVELAAAWADVMAPERLLQRLETRSALPVRRPGTRRHDSIDTMLDWSWNMLSTELRRVLEGCAVFRGGFDLDAADAVLGEGDPVIDDLEALRQRSLLRFEHAPSRPDLPRFAMLQVVSDYANARLAESGDQDRLLRAHRAWYLSLGERLAAAVQGAEPERLPELCLELDNLLAVVRRSAGVLPEISARAALAAEPALLRRGPFSDRLALLQDAVDQARRARDAGLLALALVACADARRVLGRLTEAERDLEEARSLAAQLEDPALEGSAALGRALVDYERGAFDAAAEHGAGARAAFQRCGDRWGQADALRALGQIELGRGDTASGERLSREALSLLGGRDSRREALILRNLGMIAVARGDSVLGRTHLEAALERDRALSNGWGELLTLPNLGNAYFDLGDFRKADRIYGEALRQGRTLGYRRMVGALLVNAGALARVVGDPGRAAALLGEALAIAAEFGHKRAMAYALTNLGVLHHEQGELALAAGRYAEAEALLIELNDATQRCWCVAAHAVASLEQGRVERARAGLAELATTRDQINARMLPALALSEAALGFVESGDAEAARRAILEHGSPAQGRIEARFIADRLERLLDKLI